MTLYDRLGGEPAVAALLEGLYKRALADPLFTSFFANLDMERLKAHQFAFISQALGGPHQHPGPSLQDAHSRLRIEQRHFDAFVEHLRGALQELDAADDVMAEILPRVAALGPMIVNSRQRAAN